MFGIYIHIPFCRQACHYCDFHFSTNVTNKTEMVHAIVQELILKKDYFQDKKVETIYFGGGTPSILSDIELGLIFETINSNYEINNGIEITIECNPEDITKDKTSLYKRLGINRLSIGIQTFNDGILTYLNRVHDSNQAKNAVRIAQENDITNITVDLMYALPGSSLEILQEDLKKVTSLNVPHISAYCFTLEEKTAFGKMVKQNRLKKNEEKYEEENYKMLIKHLDASGYEQYEISNFAREQQYSKHNSAYWFGRPYLGIGPGAHSFDGDQRMWNISNNPLYIENISSGKEYFSKEILSVNEKFNEAIITQLRTKWGLDCNLLNQNTGLEIRKEKSQPIENLKSAGLIEESSDFLFLTENGKLLGDKVVLDLML